MKKEELAKLLPQEGFLKLGSSGRKALSAAERAALIRKGNEQYNFGNFDLAKRIFITTGYSDGLIRSGDKCMEKGEPLEALHLYWIAPSPEKVDMFIEKTASIIRRWLQEGSSSDE
jgi:hypothetical protein